MDTVLFRVVSAADMYERKRVCNLSRNGIELIYRSWRVHIYHIIDFQFWQIPILELINLSLTFTWTYLDIFIMMMSIGLSGLFDLLNQRIVLSKGKVRTGLSTCI